MAHISKLAQDRSKRQRAMRIQSRLSGLGARLSNFRCVAGSLSLLDGSGAPCNAQHALVSSRHCPTALNRMVVLCEQPGIQPKKANTERQLQGAGPQKASSVCCGMVSWGQSHQRKHHGGYFPATLPHQVSHGCWATAPPSGQRVTLMTAVSASAPEDLQHGRLIIWVNSQAPGHPLGVRAKHLK